MLADKRKGRDRIEPGMSKEEKAINAAKFEVAFKALEEMGLLK